MSFSGMMQCMREHLTEEMRRAIEAEVAKAPPLTDAQVDLMRRLGFPFRGSTSLPPAGS